MTDPLVEVLTRIAVALEKLGSNQERSKDGTPFPWQKVSSRVRFRFAMDNKPDTFFGKTWPLTCEDLVDLGCRYLTRNARIRGVGAKAGEEIAAVLDIMGFKNWQDT